MTVIGFCVNIALSLVHKQNAEGYWKPLLFQEILKLILPPAFQNIV